jgi:hypothetical protein
MGARRGVVVLAGAAVVAMSLGTGCSAATGAATWTVRPGGGVLVNMVRLTTLTDAATGSTRACGSVISGALAANGDPATLSAGRCTRRSNPLRRSRWPSGWRSTTPPHGSWLNTAEIELSALALQRAEQSPQPRYRDG